MRALRATFIPAVRRAGTVLTALAGLAALACPVGAAQPDGSYHPSRPGEERSPGGEVRPLRWVDQSRQEFQRLMRLLAKRSVGMHPPHPRPPWPRQEPAWDWQPMPPPARPARWEPEAEEWPPRQRERERARYPAWPPHGARCRRAGMHVEGAGWYVVAQGDTLWSIAEEHYGDGGAWWRIVEANRRRLPDPSCIYVCQRLYIPHVPRRSREWESHERPARDDDEVSWVRPAGTARPVEPGGSSPRGCTDCGAGSHVSVRNGGGRSDDRRAWR